MKIISGPFTEIELAYNSETAQYYLTLNSDTIRVWYGEAIARCVGKKFVSEVEAENFVLRNLKPDWYFDYAGKPLQANKAKVLNESTFYVGTDDQGISYYAIQSTCSMRNRAFWPILKFHSGVMSPLPDHIKTEVAFTAAQISLISGHGSQIELKTLRGL